MTARRCPRRVLIDAVKAVSEDNDGIQRYGREILTALVPFAKDPSSGWRIDVYLGLWFMFDLAEVESLVRTGLVDDRIPRSARFVVRLARFRNRLLRGMSRLLPAPLASLPWVMAQGLDRLILAVTRPLDFSDWDVVHLLLPQSWGMVSRSPVRTLVTTVHDLTHASFPAFHTTDNVLNASRGMEHCVERRSGFIAVSGSTRNDLLSMHPTVPRDDVVVVHEACDRERFAPVTDPAALEAVRARYGIPSAASGGARPYLLSLSTLEPRKNLVNTIKAFLLLVAEEPDLDAVLVVAGKHGWRMEELLGDPTLHSERVVFTGFVDDADLPALYSGARALTYVSYWEGFGLPALEAMSCGTPVVYGDRGALPEVIGDAGLPAVPPDVHSIRDAFRRVLGEPRLRDELARRAAVRADAFSWERTARETLAAYDHFVDRHERAGSGDAAGDGAVPRESLRQTG